MTRTMFDNISTGIEPKGDQYQVVLKIYNNTYYLEPVDTLEKAENLNRSLDWVFMHTYQEVFFKRLRESTRNYMKTYAIMFGGVALYLIVSNIAAIPENYRLVMIAALVFGVAFYFLYELKSLRPPPILPDDDALLSLMREENKSPR